MKKLLIALACLLGAGGAFASVGIDRDRDGYEDGEAVSGYVFTSSYVTTEPLAEGPVIVTRQVVSDEPVYLISDDEVRTRRIIRRAHQTAPNHR